MSRLNGHWCVLLSLCGTAISCGRGEAEQLTEVVVQVPVEGWERGDGAPHCNSKYKYGYFEVCDAMVVAHICATGKDAKQKVSLFSLGVRQKRRDPALLEYAVTSKVAWAIDAHKELCKVVDAATGNELVPGVTLRPGKYELRITKRQSEPAKPDTRPDADR